MLVSCYEKITENVWTNQGNCFYRKFAGSSNQGEKNEQEEGLEVCCCVLLYQGGKSTTEDYYSY
jgi:hypothetical protein